MSRRRFINRGAVGGPMKTILVALPLLLLLLAPAASARDLPDPDPAFQHKDVYLPELMACLWNGSYKVLVSTPLVTVWHYTCDPRDT